MTARRYLLAASLLFIAIFAGANLLVSKWTGGARADFTESGLYTLSDGTRTVMRDLSEPIELTFVYTRSVGQEFPAIRAYAVRVRELLDTYASAGGVNLRIREIDPAPFSTAEDEALASGLIAVDTNGGDPLYFGLIGRNSVDDERVIPFLAPEQETSLEYDLTRLVARLDRPEPATIGILSTLPQMSPVTTEAGWSILREIDKTFTIEPIEEDFVTLPENIDVLLIAHPPILSDWQQWQIDQFILRNGRALIFLDPASKSAQGSGPLGMTGRQIRSDIPQILTNWGLTLSEGAVADMQTALSIETDAGDGRTVIVRHPLYLSIPPGLMSRDSMITSDLSRAVNLGAAGRFTLDDTAAGRREALMMSGPAPSDIDAEMAARDNDAADIVAAYVPREDDPAIHAVRLTGALKSTFPRGAPSVDIPDDPVYAELARAAGNEALPHIEVSESDAEIILIADTDLLNDGLHVNLQNGVKFADNAAFVLNALDSLAGGSELMSLRARAPGLRPMVRVEAMREAAQAQFFSEQARLESNLANKQARLEELQQIGATGEFFDGEVGADLSDIERAELSQLREEIVSVRGSLRQIERDFRREIDGLENRLRIFTILAGPGFIGLLGLFVWFRNRRRAAV
jgi:ABC-type uncharacterized transport system involved in gliding motility auxiliary subunit